MLWNHLILCFASFGHSLETVEESDVWTGYNRIEAFSLDYIFCLTWTMHITTLSGYAVNFNCSKWTACSCLNMLATKKRYVHFFSGLDVTCRTVAVMTSNINLKQLQSCWHSFVILFLCFNGLLEHIICFLKGKVTSLSVWNLHSHVTPYAQVPQQSASACSYG